MDAPVAGRGAVIGDPGLHEIGMVRLGLLEGHPAVPDAGDHRFPPGSRRTRTRPFNRKSRAAANASELYAGRSAAYKIPMARSCGRRTAADGQGGAAG